MFSFSPPPPLSPVRTGAPPPPSLGSPPPPSTTFYHVRLRVRGLAGLGLTVTSLWSICPWIEDSWILQRSPGWEGGGEGIALFLETGLLVHTGSVSCPLRDLGEDVCLLS